ncbi:L-2-amino-thiazoline-4-carboxylic acid hydrolase [Oscillospiraceae bacterium MB08-C2-2]|nr:L-2-amino-thiazoline-4-carboxylic acid hydrolase [Oscillospiraceae bacterium MB08-C2-2]
MSKITNNANKVSEPVQVNRDQIEHRATWMALIYDEMVKAGIDAEPIIRRAIRRCGRFHGEIFKSKCADPSNCGDFREAFLGDLGVNTFNMDNIGADSDNVNVDFHYCALVNAWQKQGFDDATIDLLCDMAMEGDRGIADAMGLSLDLKETIAQGCSSCVLHFHK